MSKLFAGIDKATAPDVQCVSIVRPSPDEEGAFEVVSVQRVSGRHPNADACALEQALALALALALAKKKARRVH
jgi:hypothetical protein